MMKLCAVLAVLLLNACGDETLGREIPSDWSIRLATASGWGGGPGIYVDSTGRNVPIDHLRRTPTSYCEALTLSKDQIDEIASLLSNIPSNVLGSGGASIQGSCRDGPVNAVVLTLDEKDYYFSYSQVESCLHGKQVPGWLSTLVGELWARHEAIKSCDAAPPVASSSQ